MTLLEGLTAITAVILAYYAWQTRRMAVAMDASRKDQEMLLKIKADIVTALFRGGVKSINALAKETVHTEEDIKKVLPDLLGPLGPIVCLGFRDDVLFFRVVTEFDSVGGDAQRQKVKADFVSALLDGGSKTLEDIKEKTGHSIETLTTFLPELLDPCGPVVCLGTEGGYRYRVKAEVAPGVEGKGSPSGGLVKA